MMALGQERERRPTWVRIRTSTDSSDASRPRKGADRNLDSAVPQEKESSDGVAANADVGGSEAVWKTRMKLRALHA